MPSRLKDFATAVVAVVEPETSALTVAQLMRQHHIGALVVVEEAADIAVAPPEGFALLDRRAHHRERWLLSFWRGGTRDWRRCADWAPCQAVIGRPCH